MDKEDALNDFLKTLKITFKNASIYNSKHPAFIAASTELKHKLDGLFTYFSPFKISFSSKSLLVEDEFLGKEKLYLELAHLFHQRKLKNITFFPGINQDELTTFVTRIFSPPDKILKQGGIREIIKKENLTHISVEELDYSQLLLGEGEEIKDIWPYILQEAVTNPNKDKIIQAADSFDKIAHDFPASDIFENADLSENFTRFFSYLKKNEENKFKICAKKLLKSTIQNKNITPESKLEKMQLLFSDLKEEDLASTILEEIITDTEFNSLSFSIFSRIINKEKHTKIANSLSELFKENETLRSNKQAQNKIKQLVSGPSSSMISEIYQQTLSSLLKDITYEEKLTFDHPKLIRNFRFILLNLLEKETNTNLINSIVDDILKEWESICQYEDYEYLKLMHKTLLLKLELFNLEESFQDIMIKIANFIEKSILDGKISLYFEYFLHNLKKSTFDVNTYLETIFTKRKTSIYIMKAYFHFFIEYLFYFNLNLEQKSNDLILLEKIVDCLKNIDTPVSLITLKNIFHFKNHFIQLKILKAMQKLSDYDSKFLMPLLKKKNIALKKEAVVILMRDNGSKKEAFDRLLAIPSPYGIRNKLILNNINIIEEKGLKDSKEYLAALSHRTLFWNKKVRERALNLLEKWNAE